MFDRGPSDEELEAIGIRREDVADTSETEIWPENHTAFRLFYEIQSQWRMGPVGRANLDYNVAFTYMDLLDIEQSERHEVMKAIRVMEQAALAQMYKD